MVWEGSLMENWYVVFTKPRQESIAEENLKRQAFRTYLPWIRQAKRRRGKRQWVIEPLFPRYLFVRLDLGRDNSVPIRSSRGVVGLIRFGERLPAVPDPFIEALMKTADRQTGIHRLQEGLFKEGDAVTILEGPLAGWRGIFKATKGERRVVILLEMLGGSTCTLDRGWIGRENE
jgi:transcriptional antiterminator RfaH